MSIRQKLNIGFGVLVTLTLIVVALEYWSSEHAAQQISQTTELHLPTVLASTRAQADLLRMLSSTRGYLALGEQKYRDDYAQAKQTFEADVMLLDSLSSTWKNVRHREELQKLEMVFEQWAQLPEQLFELRDDQLRREPALRMLMQEAQPLLLKMTLAIRKLLQGQGQREPSQENLLLFEEMAHFQASFYAMVAGLRTYITTGRESFKFEYTSNLTNNHEFLRKLQQKQNMFSHAQQRLMTDILNQRDAFLQLPEKMFHILEGEHAREDLFVFKTQALPLAETMLQSLESMTTDQQASFRLELSSGVQKLAVARRRSLIGGGLALLLGAGLALLLRHNLVERIDRVTEAARRIQAGDLSITVPVSSSDEIGTLGQTFNQMTAQLRQIMQDLTRAKDIEANTLELQPSQFALPSLLAQLAEISRFNAEKTGLNFVYEAPADLPQIVSGDQKRMRQILLNLLGNAIRFTEQGSVMFRVHFPHPNPLPEGEGEKPLSPLRRGVGGEVVIRFEVEDTGIGIASEHLEAIFQPFQQADPQRLQEGSRGLGLAISQRFLHMMGSQLHVASRVGEGSTFWFELELPVIEPPATDVPNEMQEDVSEHSLQETLTTALAALPSDWLATLRQGAADVDPEALSDIITHIHKRDPVLANALVRLIEEFEYDEILDLIQQTGKDLMV